MHNTIATIAPHDSVERFEELGVDVRQGTARFIGPREVEVNGRRIRARRFVIATGSSAFIPPIDGLKQTPYLTNETVFDLTERPDHLIIIGGGPIGIELAQAHRRLGARVSVLQRGSILGKDDSQAVEVVRRRLLEGGVNLHEGVEVKTAAKKGNGVVVTFENGGREEQITGSHLLIASGRQANVAGLSLEAAGIDYSPRGIRVDERLRTSNKKIFAIGDVTGGYQFTHMAAYQAGIVIRNTLFHLPAKVDYKAVPWVTYTDPELAHVGMSEIQVRDKFGRDVTILDWSFGENDRAQAELETDGLVKIVVSSKSRILRATIVGSGAGELILMWVLAVQEGLKISSIAGLIAPYPTLSEVSKRAAGSYYTPKLFNNRTRKIVQTLQHLP